MVNIKVDTGDFEKKVKDFRENIPKIAKKLMAYVFTKMRRDIRSNIKANFKRHKGWLLSGVSYYAFNDFSGAIFSKNSKKQAVRYASVLENGSFIVPKNGKYLYFYKGKDDKGNKILIKTKSASIPPRPFFEPVVNDYWGNGGRKASLLMDEGLQKEIKKYIEKQGGGLQEIRNSE
jgi:hypothetical protein